MRFLRLIALVLIITTLLVACTPTPDEPKRQARTYYDFFDTVCTVFSYQGDEEADFLANCRLAEAMLRDYHRLFDIYYEYSGMSNLKTVNDNAGIAPVEVDGRLIEFLLYAKEMYALTGGEVNVAMGSVLRLWHKCRETAADRPDLTPALPDPSDIVEAEKHTDIDDLVIDEVASTVYLADPHMSLDVGALGKGYVADRLTELLTDRGATAYVLNLGGSIRAIGERVSGGGWVTGITNPDRESEESFALRVTLTDVSCVTSGNYERYFTVDGRRYHHIIDKDTGSPAVGFSSVTILAESSAMADALSTALFCMSYEDGLALAERLGGIEVLWITEDGEQLMTDGFRELVIKE